MGGGLPGLVIAAALLIVLLFVVFLVVPAARDRQRVARSINAPETATLEYRVPESQDPALVLAALASDGYQAALAPEDTRLVRVACPPGVDRERARVRAVISTATSSAIDHGAPVHADRVRFTDER